MRLRFPTRLTLGAHQTDQAHSSKFTRERYHEPLDPAMCGKKPKCITSSLAKLAVPPQIRP